MLQTCSRNAKATEKGKSDGKVKIESFCEYTQKLVRIAVRVLEALLICFLHGQCLHVSY